VDGAEVLDLLVRLVDRSLVVAASDRYRLLESVAAYCVERLREAGEFAAVRQQHLAYYTGLAETAEPQLRGPGQREWLTRLDAESANLRWALEGAVERGAAAHALRLVDALAWYWVLRGRLGEARRSVTSALELAGGDTALRARVQVWQVGITILGGDGEDRATRIEAALKEYGEVGDVAGGAWARWFLAHTLCGTGDPSEGEVLTGWALEGFRELGDRWGEAAALADRSVQRLLAGDLAGAERDAARSVELFGAAGDACGQLWSVYPRAAVAEIHGDYARATRLQVDALVTVQECGLSTQAADLLSGLGRIALLTGDFDGAREYHERARRSAAEIGYRAGEINAELGLGLGARREGRLDEAETHLRAVRAWHTDVGLDGANALLLAELGFITELRGDAGEARALHEEGYATACSTGDPRAVALALEGLAAALALSGEGESAALLLGAAATTRAATGAPLPPAERSDVNRATVRAREVLKEGAFEAAFLRGEGLDPEEAVAVAAPGGTPAGSDCCRRPLEGQSAADKFEPRSQAGGMSVRCLRPCPCGDR
jgi:tetratricopeptide (TPR) repeat protein